MKTLILLLSFVSSIALGQVPSDVIIRHAEKTWSSGAPAPTNMEDCRARIKQIICWVEPAEKNPGTERPCLAGGEKYATYFEGHFDRSPVFIKEMYCHLDHLWIEKDFFATAYASPVFDAQGKMVGGGVGARQEIFDGSMSFDSWLSWKEETSFGGGLSTSDKPLDLIRYQSNRNSKEFFIDYVMNHEFGHLFDFANQINQTTKCEWVRNPDGSYSRVGDCKPIPGTWTDFSWFDIDHAKPEQKFPFFDDICFYSCQGKYIEHKNAAALFEGIGKSNFHSTYASRNLMDDWAEAFALLIAHDYFGFNYGVEIHGRFFDMSQHFYSPVMEPKRTFVQKFIAGPKIYPGQQ